MTDDPTALRAREQWMRLRIWICLWWSGEDYDALQRRQGAASWFIATVIATTCASIWRQP